MARPFVVVPRPMLLLGYDRSRRCNSCLLVHPTTKFPDAEENPTCTHKQFTYSDCWEKWLEAQLSSQLPSQVSCVQCPNILGQAGLRAYGSGEQYERYLDLQLKETLANDPYFHQCMSPHCDSGQLHYEGEIFECNECFHRHCVSCAAPWHSGMTCSAFQQEPRVRAAEPKAGDGILGDRLKEEFAIDQVLKRTTKDCPGPECGRKIEKDGGCEHMSCSICGYQFCWLCLADYKRILEEGNRAHEKDCEHWREAGSPIQAQAELENLENLLLRYDLIFRRQRRIPEVMREPLDARAWEEQTGIATILEEPLR